MGLQGARIRLGMLLRDVPNAGRGVAIVLGLCLVALVSFLSSSESSSFTTVLAKAPSSHIHYSLADISLPPFPDLHGARYDIWQPLYEKTAIEPPVVLAEPEVWIPHLQKRFEWLDRISVGNQERTTLKRAEEAYLEVLKLHVSGLIFGKEERSLGTEAKPKTKPLNTKSREGGRDFPYIGVTMTGKERLDNVRTLIQDVVARGIPGDYIETGVWRGGNSIYARGVLRSLGQGNRRSFVCDSFKGLPPGDRSLDKRDKGWDKRQYLEVSSELVKGHFAETGLLDPGVVFAKGFFNDTMPVLKNHVDKLAIMRLDGDMYESTVDVLYNLYDKLSVGGYVIMDDWFGFPSRRACEDFFAVHGFQPDMVTIDALSAYWQKTEEIEIQYWRYEKLDFKASKGTN